MLNRRTALVAVAVCLATAIPALADGPSLCGPISTSLDIARVSKYVWHGLVLNPDPAVQPSLTFANTSGLSLNVWGSFDTTDITNHSNNFTELDYTLGYSWKTPCNRPMALKVGYVTFPHTSTSNFARFTASTQLVDYPLSPCVTVKYDAGSADGACAIVGVGREVPLGMAQPLSISAELSAATTGFNRAYFGVHKTGVTDLLLGVSMPMEKRGSTVITPSLSYAYILDNDLARSVNANGGGRNSWIFSLTAASSF